MARTFAPLRPVLHRVLYGNQTVPNESKEYETNQNMSLEANGVDRVHCWEKFRRDFVAWTFALVWPVLHLVLLRTQTNPNASK